MNSENINFILKNILKDNLEYDVQYLKNILIKNDKLNVKVKDTNFNKYYKYFKINDDIKLSFALDLYLINMEIEENYSISSFNKCSSNINDIIKNSSDINNEDDFNICKDIIYKALDRKLIDISITNEMVDNIIDYKQDENLNFII